MSNDPECPYCHGQAKMDCYCIPLTCKPDAFKDNPELRDALVKATDAFNALSIEERKAHRDAQRESYIRAEMSWPEPKFEMKMIDGVLTKVYASYADYCAG